MAKPKSPTSSQWHSHFFYRKQVLKTTWKFRLLFVLVLIAIFIVPHRFWAGQIGNSLVCKKQIEPSDALLLENFDLNYHVFERAAALQKAGVASRALVPSLVTVKPSGVLESSMRVTRLVAQTAKLETFDLIPVREIEPITQNAARQIRDFLKKENIKSVVFVTPGFRSRRSELVFDEELTAHGIRVGCSPVFANVNPENWTSTWHGMQQVIEQFFKLQYYRFYVLL
jgi:uncharacterized SAM-binding protein YcdF (DUF218 family)